MLLQAAELKPEPVMVMTSSWLPLFGEISVTMTAASVQELMADPSGRD